MALLKDYAVSGPMLHKNIITPKSKSATYISPRSRSEIINVIEYDYILSDLITEINVLADEVSCHTVEHLPSFVDSNCNIREEFIAFIKLGRVRVSAFQRL